MKPAIFNTAMVRAILDGRKTQTRRELKVPIYTVFSYKTEWENTYTFSKQEGTATKSFTVKAPYKVGDIIYVRETFVVGIPDGTEPESESNPLTVFYKADNNVHGWLDEWENDVNIPWKPSIHMPKEYARLFLRVKDVRIERLNEISEEDARAEGIEQEDTEIMLDNGTTVCCNLTMVASFRQLWESIYGDGSFDNRYVWVIEFERISKEEAQ